MLHLDKIDINSVLYVDDDHEDKGGYSADLANDVPTGLEDKLPDIAAKNARLLKQLEVSYENTICNRQG